ncbi:LysR family transcriptional regulator [Bradyrhizobium cenepequi]|uniref:LysR family transcriptional regulator n=1 Tax=Bradyrhizobium cenepequi TaxID=2821403 RepID=UPI001CE2CA9B|nr:LysR family transcriptional regulator [Bradyrhizobium cenepequi]MCA6111282.1 LysR family transcriptional regulator [Bradyrhizobium cenepequi]
MELRHLRYFVAVAEELHFTRAAERLGMKQPPLSLQIRQLETELGTRLFRRLTRGIELTETGMLLLDDARRILDQVERTKASVLSRARGESGGIHVGFAGATYFQPLVPGIIRAYRERYPGVLLSPQQSNTPQLVSELRTGEIDTAFIRPPISDSEELAILPLIEEPMLIVLPAVHSLANRDAVPVAALAQETLILFPRAIGPGLHDAIIAACQRAGFSPNLGQEAPQIPSIVYMVAAGFGVSIVPQSTDRIRAEGVRYLPIKGDGPVAPISLAYRRDDHSPAVRNFVELARQSGRAAHRRRTTR